MTPYDAVNATWPATIPPITTPEATRAATKLVRHFGTDLPGAMARVARVRRCWTALDPTRSSSLRRGWKRLVHDLSHRIHRRRLPHFTSHGIAHADLERTMIAYVVEKGWLAGTLKPKVTPPRKPGPADKLAALEAALKRWETKRKRAETAIKKLGVRIRRARKITIDKASTTL